jgi:hypothetical protein
MGRDKEHWNAYMREFRKTHPRTAEKRAAQNARNSRNQQNEKTTPEGRLRVKNRYFLREHGITLEQRNAIIVEQDNLCLICGRLLGDDNMGALSPVVDHSHLTGKRRGILHRVCNSAIGLLEDSPDLLRRAADYLEKSQCP